MTYSISDLSKLAGVSNRTLRYYDQIGLLCPRREKNSNYRFYDANDVDKLQQILLLKEMGVSLSDIKKLMKTMDNDKRIEILYTHLICLETKSQRIDELINNVRRTIKSLSGERIMTDKEKFEGLKKDFEAHDNLYKDEVIDKWGYDSYEKSKNQFKNMNEEQFMYFNNLATSIIDLLKIIKEDNKNEENRKKVALLHKEWISMAWGFYDKQIHLNVVDMYILDERFKKYYDSHGEGLALILKEAVHQYV